VYPVYVRCPAVRNAIVSVALLVGIACVRSAPTRAEDIVGQWDKEDPRLPPISLTLSSDGRATVARLRLSGSELNGTAVVEGARLRLSFPGRPDVVGEFVSTTELKLRLSAGRPDYTLTKRDR
jgi:hypothetical protein